jgi:hypothetical protein
MGEYSDASVKEFTHVVSNNRSQASLLCINIEGCINIKFVYIIKGGLQDFSWF